VEFHRPKTNATDRGGCLLGTGLPVIVSERIHPRHSSRTVAASWRLGRVQLDLPRWRDGPCAWQNLRQLPNGSPIKPRVKAARRRHFFRMRTQCGRDIRNRLTIAPAGFRCASVDPCDGTAGEAKKALTFYSKHFCRAAWTSEGWHLWRYLAKAAERQGVAQAGGLRFGIADALIPPGVISPKSARGWRQGRTFFCAGPRRYEGIFPNALLEAMQTGRACISFDCPPGGPRDPIPRGETGPQRLAGCRRRGRRTALGRGAPASCRRFARPATTPAWARESVPGRNRVLPPGQGIRYKMASLDRRRAAGEMFPAMVFFRATRGAVLRAGLTVGASKK